jgi:hypothetical protein
MIDEHDVREMLHRRANAVPTPVVDAPKAARRARRRLFANGAVAMLAAAVIALAGLAGVDEIRGASVPADQPTPSVTPSTGPFTERFDSPLNVLSIGYPSGWQTRAATEPWGHDAVTFDAPDVDVIFDPTLKDDLYLAVVSEPLGSPSGPEWEWVSDMQGDLRSVGICMGPGGEGGGSETLFGHYAWFHGCDEPHGASGSLVIFRTDTSGYIIYLHVGDERAQRRLPDADGDWIEAVLKTVVLPEDALIEWPIPSASP